MTKNQKKLFDAVRNLSEIDRKLSSNLDLTSLAEGKMSDFLFEKDEGIKSSKTKEGDEGSAVDVLKNIKQATEALSAEIAGLEKVGEALGSDAVKKIATELNGKLVKIQLGKTGVFDDLTQKSLKQTVYLANGVSRARVDIKTAITATLSALKTMGVPQDSDKKIREIIPEDADAEKPYPLKVEIKQEEFKQGIINKLGESGKSGVVSFFKNLLGSNQVKLDKSVVIDASLFAEDILSNSPKNLLGVYKQPIVANPEETKVDDSVKAATEAAPKEATSGGKSAEESSSKEDKKATPKMTDLLQLKKDNKEAGQNLKQTLGKDKWNALSKNFREKPADVLNVLNDILPALKDADIIKYESKVKQQQLILERLNELAGTSSKKN